MLTKTELKEKGIQLMRNLQLVMRTATVFNVEHQSVVLPLQQLFDGVNHLLREANHVTIGFSEGRAMINNVFAMERTLQQLEAEFDRRHLGAISFEPGLTLARLKKVIAVIAAQPKTIDAAGGTKKYLEQNHLEGVRFYTADEVDSTTGGLRGSGIIGGEGSGVAGAMGGLELILGAAGLEASNVGVAGSADLMHMVAPTLEAVLARPDGDLHRSYLGLERMLNEVQADFVSSNFPTARHPELAGATVHQIATEFVEDTAARWSARRLGTAPPIELPNAEDEVMNVLVRSLAVTQVAERLARKLSESLKEYTVPQEVQERIREELRWVALPLETRYAHMMQVQRYDAVAFRRYLPVLKELLAVAKTTEASFLANHYFDILNWPEIPVTSLEVTRGMEVISVMQHVRSEFPQRTADRLVEAVARGNYDGAVHAEIAKGIAALGRGAALNEDYHLAHALGAALEKSAARDPARHAACCTSNLGSLLNSGSTERLIETFLEKRDDSAWARTVGTLLRYTGGPAVDRLFQQLESEKSTANRLALLRLFGQTGTAGIAVARHRLNDERWYVVRNACQVLSMLKDPEMLERVAPLLHHPDDRVQHVATTGIIKSRMDGRGRVLAENLFYLRGRAEEEALHELIFLKDPETVKPLMEFVVRKDGGKRPLDQALQALTLMPGEAAVPALGRILTDTALPMPVRRMALDALRKCNSETSRAALAQFAAAAPSDPLATLCTSTKA